MDENGDDVFINCPFDSQYKPLFQALLFTVHDCGFRARCALEVEDSGDARIEKLYRIIEQCRYGIHDISRTEPDPLNHLPRFNMPLELGIFLGARRFGDEHNRRKRCLILDREPYRYQGFCSDLAGQDIKPHAGQTAAAITATRNWLRQWITSSGARIPGGKTITQRYEAFRELLPIMCDEEGLDEAELTYVDYHKLIVGWLQEYPGPGVPDYTD